jgi:succinate dehydrogenase / fumarate reductase membrane anchor subunit
MTTNAPDFRTALGKVRGLGSARHGVGHWWLQRMTALALIPLSLWFVSALVSAMLSPNVVVVAEWFSSPVNAILMVVMLVALFMHAKLGVQVVVEDYVHGPFAKYAALLANGLICYLFMAICILAVLKLHFLDIVTSL